MFIGELSKQSGLSRDTIRFYEKNKLFTVGRKERRDNNYKEYSEATLQRLMNIRQIKGFGFTLNEVSELLDMIDVNAASCNNVLDKFDDKVKKIDEKIRELIGIRTLLLNGQKACQIACCSPTIEEVNCKVIIATF
ncbi:MAG: MerR family transcriptional regulator [Saprospiraceae bacterium]